MAKPAGSVEQVVDLNGHTVGGATNLLVNLAHQLGYAVAPTSPGVYRLARTRRKMFGREHETLTARVYEARSGPGIRLVGDVADELVAHLSQAAANAPAVRQEPAEPSPVALAQLPAHEYMPIDSPPAPAAWPTPTTRAPIAPASWVAASPAPALDHPTVARAVAPVSTCGWVVDLPDGRRVPVEAALLIGRDPDERHGPLGSMVVAVDHATVSKTHLLIEPKGSQVAVTDLHSTNGTTVDAGSISQVCQPGVPVLLSASGVVDAGDARLLVRPVQ